MMIPKIYLIPGMGADGRLFEGLRREGLEFEVLEFIPALPKESLREYALRLALGIDTDSPFVIGGVSLGGIMATEIAKAFPTSKLLLISSVKNSSEFPFYFRLGRILPFHKVFSGEFMRRNGPRASLEGLPEWQAKILRDLRNDADPAFISWAVDAAVHWRSSSVHADCLHVQGTRDMMFPGVLQGKRVKVRGGRHVMVVTHAAEIVREIRGFLGMEASQMTKPIV